MATTATKERPILFSGEMVRAILAGKKTQTRRIIKHRENRWEVDERDDGTLWPYWPCYVYAEPQPIDMPCPYGEVGDRLWVRESWNVSGLAFGMKPSATKFASPWAFRYKATDATWQHGWKPSIHMPRWASRIMLEVTDVRVERLHDISEEDAKAEGVVDRIAFKLLWCSINGRESWDANPWLWVVSFSVSDDDCIH